MVRTQLIAVALLASSTTLALPAAVGVSSGPPLLGPQQPVPKLVVPGDVLLKIPHLDEVNLKRADRGDRRAQLRVANAIDALGSAGLGLVYVRRLPAGFALFHVDGIDEDETIQRVEALRSAPGVKGAAPNRWMRAFATPNDEFFGEMWHLDPIGAPAAWDVTTGESNQRVGVIDTGTVLSHEDLAGKDAGGFDFITDDFIANDGGGRDSNYDDPGDGADCGDGQGFIESSFHGSHVAGTILANADNGVGIAGVNWESQLITVRALGRCGGANADIMEGMAWLAGFDIDGVPPLPTADRPRVLNLSLGGEGACDDFSKSVTDLVADQGALPIIAAGNDGGPVNSPANCPSAIAVGAYGRGGDNPLASYSSFGAEIDIVGPGGEQSVAFEDGVLSLFDGNQYIFYQGTSMATPHIAGIVSLLLALDPTLSRSEILGVLQTTGDFCRDCNGKVAARADLAILQVTEVNTNPGDSCTSFCSPGQACVDGTCATTCNTDADCGGSEKCDPADDVCVADEPAEGEGEGEGGEGGEGGGGAGSSGTECDPLRGNLDCPNNEGCRDNENTGTGVCVRGADDGDRIGSLCEEDDDCETGLCDRGVCTVTCDFDDGDCQDGFECDEDAAPGGLCRGESCVDEEDDFCEDGSVCHYTSSSQYICAEGNGNYARCTHTTTSRGTPLGALAIVAGLLLAVVTRRRRRC